MGARPTCFQTQHVAHVGTLAALCSPTPKALARPAKSPHPVLCNACSPHVRLALPTAMVAQQMAARFPCLHSSHAAHAATIAQPCPTLTRPFATTAPAPLRHVSQALATATNVLQMVVRSTPKATPTTVACVAPTARTHQTS